MGKVNAKGRNKNEAHIRLHHGVTNSEAWRSMTCEARALLIEVWVRHNGGNNGRIPFSHREARATLSAGRGGKMVHGRKVIAAFEELQEKGFLVVRDKGSFNWKVGAGEGRATEWEITTEPCDGKPAKKTYRTWTEKQNTGATVEAIWVHSGSRKGKSTQEITPNDCHSGSRSSQFHTSSGCHSGSTLYIPGATPAFIRPELEGMEREGFTPDVALAELAEAVSQSTEAA